MRKLNSSPNEKAIVPLSKEDNRSYNTFTNNSSSDRRYKRSGKGGPCPICGRTKDADCRWNDEVALCHQHVYEDARVPGYVYRGSKDIWGQYFPISHETKGPKQLTSPQKNLRPKGKREFFYKDSEGNPLVKVSRNDNGSGEKRFFQSHWDGQIWVKGLNPEVKRKIRLYRIDDPVNQAAITQGLPLLIVEGEGKANILLDLSIAATCSIGGAGKWQSYGYPNYLHDLAGAKVVLCPDQDEPGLAHCHGIEQDFPDAQWLYAYPQSSLWQQLPRKGGLDIADWVNEFSLTAEQVLAEIEPKRNLELKMQVTTEQKEPQKSSFEWLQEIADEAEYFHTPDQKPFAEVREDGIRKVYPIKHSAFKHRLQYQLHKRYQKTVSTEILNRVLSIVEAKALFEGEQFETHLRVAEYEGKVYLDLGTGDWKAIEISAEGWRIVSDPPVRFKRPDTLLPLPIPEMGGTLDELRQLLNVDNEGWVLIATWLLFSFYPKFPHPVLILQSEQGSGKSLTARILSGFIDPQKAPLLPSVVGLRELAVTAENRWILTYDNLSGLSVEQSDALCRICTGGGYCTRKLYEDDQVMVLEFLRPQILTGIDALAIRGDLIERSLLVELPPISERRRMTEAELEAKLTDLKPLILGALLTALSKTLRELPKTKPDQLPRMADFARFGVAAEKALDLPIGSFQQIYCANQQEAHEAALETSPVAVGIQQFMESRSIWEGTVTQLLDDMEESVDEKALKRSLLRGPRSFGKTLQRLIPTLRMVGINVGKVRKRSMRLIRIEKMSDQMSQTSLMSQPNQKSTFRSDVSKNLKVTKDMEDVTEDEIG